MAFVWFVLGAASSASAATAPHTRVHIGNAAYSVSEGAGVATITVHRNGNTSGTTSVSVAIANGTADSPADYTNNGPHAFTFASKEKKKTFTIPIANDTADEADETFNLTLSIIGGTGALGTPHTSVVTIVDNDLSGSSLAIGNASGSESVGSLVFDVTLSPAASQPVSVQFQTAPESAAGGSDYTSQSGTVTFAAGVVVQTVSVPITDDTVDELQEHFVVILFSPVNGVIADQEAVGNITDNDPPPTISVKENVTGNEGDALVFTLELSGPAAQTVAVDVFTSPGTANGQPFACNLGSHDYVSNPAGTVIFDPGDPLSKTISVTTCEDATDESDETFTFAFEERDESAPFTYATIGTASRTGTIVDDDAPAGDTTAPLSTSASVADNDDDGYLSDGDVITIAFNEAMSTAVDLLESITYNGGEVLAVGTMANYVWTNSTTLTITVTNTNICPIDGSCQYGSDLTAMTVNFIEDLAGNDWALGGDVTLDVEVDTAPASVFATVAEASGSNDLSVGDVITIAFDEAMSSGDFDPLEGITYNGIEKIEAGTEASYILRSPTVLEITITSALDNCPSDPACDFGNSITATDPNFIEDLSGEAWTLSGDVLLEETTVTTSIDDAALQDCAVLPVTFCNVNPVIQLTVTISQALPYDLPVGFIVFERTAVQDADYSPSPSPRTITAGQTTTTVSALLHDGGRGCEGMEYFTVHLLSSPGTRIADSAGVGSILDIDCADESEPNNTAGTADPVAPAGFPTEGILTVGDVDFYSLSAAAGEIIEVRTAGPCSNGFADTIVTLYAPDGTTELASDDDSGGSLCSLIGFTAPTTGTYFFKVEELGGDAEIAYEVRAVATA